MLAEDDVVFHQAMLFAIGERSERRERVDARFFDHAHEAAVVRIIPANERKIRALCIADRISGEARVCDEPAFIDAR